MAVDGELITAILSALAGLLGGAGISVAVIRKQLKTLSSNLTAAELLEIFSKISKAVSQNSPAGETITTAEAEALGRAVWAALHD